MSKLYTFLSFLIILLFTYFSFSENSEWKGGEDETEHFQVENALEIVKKISRKPHYVGTNGHSEVRNYLIEHLQNLGLDPQLQVGYFFNEEGTFCKVNNILARIHGKSSNNEAIMLLSHYDSSPHSSFGASDDASGVATILEGIRNIRASDIELNNDIVIMLSDAEELGLNGSRFFVDKHNWFDDIKVVINFEARGTSGPSYIFVESNIGNAHLVKGLVKSNIKNPIGNSLLYDIYKLMPNDTDLTAFSEEGIPGYNLAFIDDYFNYHTSRDNYNNLDSNSVKHQGEYLTKLIRNIDIPNLDNNINEDFVFFRIPFSKFITYAYSTSWVIYILSLLFFILVIFMGIKSDKLNWKAGLRGFIPFFLSLILSGAITYILWVFILRFYPQYQEINHNFTYNGYYYVFSFGFLSVGICFYVYNRFKHINPINLLLAPIIFWLIVCGYLQFFFKGATFLVFPVIFSLIALLILMKTTKPNFFLLLFAFPTIWILIPYLKLLPLSFGLNMLVLNSILIVLIFTLLLFIFSYFCRKKILCVLFLSVSFFCIVLAHFNSSFDISRPKPNSLVYLLNSNSNKAYWGTFDGILDTWTRKKINSNFDTNLVENNGEFNEELNNLFTYKSQADLVNIPKPEVEVLKDTFANDIRKITIKVSHNRDVNRLEIYLNTMNIKKCRINGIDIPEKYLDLRESEYLFTHIITDNENTYLELVVPETDILELTLFESSFNLLENNYLSVEPRPSWTIAKPFILNDAIIIRKKVLLD